MHSLKRKRVGRSNGGSKKSALVHGDSQFDEDAGINPGDIGCDTKSALYYLRSLFHVELFENRMPPIMLQHQLYAIIHSRTVADKELGELREAGDIRLFRLGTEDNMMAVVFTDDYRSHVLNMSRECSSATNLIERFLSSAVVQLTDVSYSRQMLSSLSFTDTDITQLVNVGVLTVRDVGSWWLAIPSAGIFVKSLSYGRRTLLSVFLRCKYREILKSELQQKRLPKAAKLGMLYHIYDSLGADQIYRVHTTSGDLLRLRYHSKSSS